MEENTSIFSNKIVGVLVAVIVLATVLVPICNAFSNSGGNDAPSPLADDEDGIRATLVDLSDHSKTYNITPRLLEIEGEQVYSIGISETVILIPTLFPIGSSSYFSEIEVYFDDELDSWVTSEHLTEVSYSLTRAEEMNWKVWLYGEGDYNVHYVAWDSPIQSVDTTPYIAVVGELIYGDEDCILSYSWGVSTEFEVFYDIEGDWTTQPEVTMANKIISINGDFEDDEGNSITQTDGYWLAISSNEPTPGSDSGIAGTIIGYIPVFVAVALLGAIVTLFINKKD